jgi:hypothetical protein
MTLSRNLFATTVATAFATLIALPAQAATFFGTQGISFDKDTTVEFSFTGSNNLFTSFLDVLIVDGGKLDESSAHPLFGEVGQSDDPASGAPWTSTCANINPTCVASFTFKAGQLYTLRLTNIVPEPEYSNDRPRYDYVYSTSAFNGGVQRAVFGSYGSLADLDPFEDAASYQTIADPIGTKFISFAFEDGAHADALEDHDFNDFRIMAEIPVPPPLAGLLLFGALNFFRRRKEEKAEADESREFPAVATMEE